MKKPSITPIILALFALACIVALNVIAGKITPKSPEQEQAEAAAAQKKAQDDAAKSGNAGGAAPANTAAASPGDNLVALGDDTTLGNQNGTHMITIGWSWTPAVQADPSKIYGVVDAVTKQAPDVKIRVVNTDSVPNTLAGLSIDGKTIISTMPDGSIPTAPLAQLRNIIGAASKNDAPPGPAASPGKVVPAPQEP